MPDRPASSVQSSGRTDVSAVVRTSAHLAALAALFGVVGGLEEVRGRHLGHSLEWSLSIVASVLLFAWATSRNNFSEGLARGLFERGRNLLLAVLAWPLLVDLADDGMERKRVVLIGVAAAGYVVIGAPLVGRFMGTLAARRRAAWSAFSVGLLAIVAYALIGGGSDRLAPQAPERPLSTNLLLISVDTTRADALGCYGGDQASTPAIDGLAEGGVLFQQAIAQAPHTHGSMASLLTSKYPIEHRSIAPQPALAAEHETLATRLWRAGYTTAAFLDNPWLRPEFGFDRGYQEFTAAAPVPRILEWLEDHAAERFFLHVHFLHPHGPYEPRSPWIEGLSPDYEGPWGRVGTDVLEEGEEPGAVSLSPADLERFRALYASEVSAVDSDIGSLLGHLAALGLEDETLVVFVADHGEEFGDHGALNHSHTLYDELVHVPLVMRLPGRLDAGLQVRAQVQLVDVSPTVLDLLEVEASTDARGQSLVKLLDGEALQTEPRIAISQRYDIRQRHLLAARDGRWKLHALLTPTGPDQILDWDIAPVPGREWEWRNRYRLYDLESDPGEQHNVYGEFPQQAQRLVTALVEWRELNEPHGGLGEGMNSLDPGISEETLRDLKALGYLGGR